MIRKLVFPVTSGKQKVDLVDKAVRNGDHGDLTALWEAHSSLVWNVTHPTRPPIQRGIKEDEIIDVIVPNFHVEFQANAFAPGAPTVRVGTRLERIDSSIIWSAEIGIAVIISIQSVGGNPLFVRVITQ